MKSSRAISRVRCLYETDISRTISVLIIREYQIHDDDDDDDDQDGHRNFGFIQTPYTADSPKSFIEYKLHA